MNIIMIVEVMDVVVLLSLNPKNHEIMVHLVVVEQEKMDYVVDICNYENINLCMYFFLLLIILFLYNLYI